MRPGRAVHDDTLGVPVRAFLERRSLVDDRVDARAVSATSVIRAESSSFADTTRFPPGSVALDSALLLRAVPVTWRPRPALRVGPPAREEVAA